MLKICLLELRKFSICLHKYLTVTITEYMTLFIFLFPTQTVNHKQFLDFYICLIIAILITVQFSIKLLYCNLLNHFAIVVHLGCFQFFLTIHILCMYVYTFLNNLFASFPGLSGSKYEALYGFCYFSFAFQKCCTNFHCLQQSTSIPIPQELPQILRTIKKNLPFFLSLKYFINAALIYIYLNQ